MLILYHKLFIHSHVDHSSIHEIWNGTPVHTMCDFAYDDDYLPVQWDQAEVLASVRLDCQTEADRYPASDEF